MAWITYDMIKERREEYSDDLPYPAVFSYLESLGFDVDTSTKSSHMHARTPDRQDMWTFTKHGGKSHLTRLEVKALYEKLTDYFERESAREEQKLKDSVKEVEAFPKWLITDGYLAKLGVKLKPEDIVHQNGAHTLVLIDREFPEFSVRVNYDYNGKALTQESIEGAVKKLRVIKESYMQAVNTVLAPYANVIYATRVKQDGKFFCELRDVNSNDFIASIPIPNMAEEDPAKRNQLLNAMILDIDTKAAAVVQGLAETSVAAAEVARKRAEDLEHRAERREEKAIVQEREAAIARRAEFQEQAVRLGDLGFSLTETVRDGKRGFICKQDSEAVAIAKRYVAILENLPEQHGPYLRNHLKQGKGIAPKHIASAYRAQSLVLLNEEIPGQCFIPFTKDEDGNPTAEGTQALEHFVKRVEVSSSPTTFMGAKPVFKNGCYGLVTPSYSVMAPKGYNANRSHRYILLKIMEQGALSFTFSVLRDELVAAGIDIAVMSDGNVSLKTPTWNVTVEHKGSYPNLNFPEARLVEGVKKGIEKIIACEIDKLEADGVCTVTHESDGKCTLRVVGVDAEPVQIEPYDADKRNLADIMRNLTALRQARFEHNGAVVLQASLSRMQEYGYCLIEKKGEVLWQPPMDIESFKRLAGGKIVAKEGLQRRITEAEAIVANCDARFQQQNDYLSKLTSFLGEAAVTSDETAITIMAEGKEFKVAFARLREDDKHAQKPLVTDAGMAQLKKLVREYNKPLSSVHAGGEREHVVAAHPVLEEGEAIN